jgi:hypothetical protein
MMMLMTVQPAAWQRSFSQLRNRMSGGAETASAVEHRRLVEEMPIHQFCEARELTLPENGTTGNAMPRRWSVAQTTLASRLPAVDAAGGSEPMGRMRPRATDLDRVRLLL